MCTSRLYCKRHLSKLDDAGGPAFQRLIVLVLKLERILRCDDDNMDWGLVRRTTVVVMVSGVCRLCRLGDLEV